MTRYQARCQLELLSETIHTMIKDEEVLEDTKIALEFAIADMDVLQDIITRVDGIINE